MVLFRDKYTADLRSASASKKMHPFRDGRSINSLPEHPSSILKASAPAPKKGHASSSF